MGKSDEQKLAETIADARALVTEMRGMQKDARLLLNGLKENIRTAREILAQECESRVVDMLNERVADVYAELDQRVLSSAKNLQKSMDTYFGMLHDSAFGKGRKAEDYAKLLHVVKHAVRECAREGGGVSVEESHAFISNVMFGMPGVRSGEYDGGYAVQIGGDGPADFVFDLRQGSAEHHPVAEQYRRLGNVLIGHGFEKHGRDVINEADTLVRVNAEHAAAGKTHYTRDALESGIREATRDRASAKDLCDLFDLLLGDAGGTL